MSQKNIRSGFTIGDGFRLGLGFAVANALIALLCAVVWFLFLAGVLGGAFAAQG